MARRQEFSEDSDDGDTRAPSKSELKRPGSRPAVTLVLRSSSCRSANSKRSQLPEKLLRRRRWPAARSRAMAHGCDSEMYIGKVLRDIDVDPIRPRSPSAVRPIVSACRREHAARAVARTTASPTNPRPGPSWRRPHPDRRVLQQMRALAKQARAEQAAARPPAASRQLFRRLREACLPAAKCRFLPAPQCTMPR